MRLRLALKGPERLMGGVRETLVETGSLVIGRSADAGWVISDPERVVSKAHCEIERRPDGFLLTDTSTNGVFVNGVPLGRGGGRMLADGDILTLGDAIIEVALDAGLAAATADVPAAVEGAQAFSGGPFGLDEAAGMAAPSLQGARAASKPENGGLTVLRDWWIPDAGAKQSLDPKPMDAVGGEVKPPAAEGVATGEAMQLRGKLDLMAAARGMDVTVFAASVEKAASILSRDDRHRFLEHLVELLDRERVR